MNSSHYISHLSVGSWNVQGLKGSSYNKLDDPTFIKEISKHHVIGLVETHCTHDSDLTVPGYCSYQACRPKSGNKAHGGVVALVKTELKKGVKFYPARTNDLVWVCLKKEFFNTNEDIYIAVVYLSPINSTYAKRLDYDVFDVLEQEIAKFSSKGQVIVMGDFNARTSTFPDCITDSARNVPILDSVMCDESYVCRKSQDSTMTNCSYGKRLIELCVSSGLKVVNGRIFGDPLGKFTCHKHNGSSLIDYVLADASTLSQIRYLTVEDYTGDFSDHCMLSFGLAVSITIHKHSKTKLRPAPRKYKWNEGAASQLQEALKSDASKQMICKLLTEDIQDINLSIEALNGLITTAASRCLKQTYSHSKKKKQKKWFNTSCATMRNQLKQLAKSLSHNPNNPQIRSVFFSTKRRYKKLLKITKISFKQELSAKLEKASEADPKVYWQLLEQLKNVDKVDDGVENPVPVEDWVEHFRDLYKPHELTDSDRDVINELEGREKVKVFNELSFRISQEEIRDAINALKGGKAPGPDNITGEIIKASVTSITPILEKIFNHVLSTGSYPSHWCEGIITAIHKKGSKIMPDNYRGITVSSCLGKVFGSILNKRLILFCDKHNIIDERQSSHRKKCRTTDNIFILRSIFEKYCINENKKLYACFVDFRKAFDSIWHEALFLKLQRLGIAGPFFNTIKSMYKNVTSTVKVNKNGLSESFSIQRGVKQGDMLSPMLFNIFINDIMPCFHGSDNQAPDLLSKQVGCLMYADDLVILSTSPHGLQTGLDRLDSYCKKWKLEVNLNKSKAMCFNKQGKFLKKEFKIGGETLECVKSYTYLGIDISNSCALKHAQKALFDKAMRALFKLKGLLHGSGMNPLTSLKLFDQLVKPIALYGSELWGADILSMLNPTKFFESMEKVLCEKLNMSISRFILGVHKKSQTSAVRGELGRAPLAIDIVANVLKFREYLRGKEKNSLLHEAMVSGNNLSQKNDSRTWLSRCNNMEAMLKSDDANTVSDLSKRKQIKNCLGARLSYEWLNKIQNEDKMRTYTSFKRHFVPEDYLSLKQECHRKALTRFRISAHTLAIERGRYTTPKTPVEQRICRHCPDRVEDEMHFLTECGKFINKREILFGEITKRCHNFTHLNNKERFEYMLSAGGEIVALVAHFVYENLP